MPPRRSTGPSRPTWTFEPLDAEAFPAVDLARAAGRAAGTAPAVYNAANEDALAAFVAGRLPFLGIVDTIAEVLGSHQNLMNVSTLADVQGCRGLGAAPGPGAGGKGDVRVSYAIGVIAFVVALLLSVMLHEAGHFATAKSFGMKASRFFVGFGPTLWSTRRGETEYGIKAIPAGGFVKIEGMTALEELEPGDEDRAFYKQPALQRTVVLAAGSMVHFILAIGILFAVIASTGADPVHVRPSTKIAAVEKCVPRNPNATACASTDPAAPALGVLRAGDRVVAVNGTRCPPTTRWPRSCGRHPARSSASRCCATGSGTPSA